MYNNECFAYLFIGGLINEMGFLFAFCYSNVTDKVFSPTCSAQKVYEEGAKDVALSALTGINGQLQLIFSVQLVILIMFLE